MLRASIENTDTRKKLWSEKCFLAIVNIPTLPTTINNPSSKQYKYKNQPTAKIVKGTEGGSLMVASPKNDN